MLELTDIGTIKALLARHGFHFSKALGQNFIVNPSVCPRMADESGIDSESGVIEIGAGIGVLTAELAKRAKKVVCIELDSKLLPILDETLADFDNIEIINADVLKTDLAALIEEKFGGMPVYVCANLPYYITSPVIMTLLESRLPLKAVTVMVQREAAQRLLLPVDSLWPDAPQVTVDAKAERLARCGNPFALGVPDGTYRIYAASGEFLLLAQVTDGMAVTIKSFFEVS